MSASPKLLKSEVTPLILNQPVFLSPAATPLIVSNKALRNSGSAESPASRTRLSKLICSKWIGER